jgi:hypothetical protein
MKNVRTLLSLFMILFMSAAAIAHPGHGHHQQEPMGLMHYLSSPIHVISLLLIISLVVFMAYRKGFLPFKPADKKVSK